MEMKKNQGAPSEPKKAAKPQVVRQKGESEENYLKRLSRLKNSRLSEALYAAKYNVKISRNEVTGEMKISSEKNEIDELLLAKKLGRRAPKKKDPAAKKAALLKLKLKKKERRVKEDDPLRQTEVIPFGERVDAPPTLVAPRKATKDESRSKNARSGLLLAQMLHQNTVEKKEIDFTKIHTERERANIVKLYKEIKKKRRAADPEKKYAPGSSLWLRGKFIIFVF